MSDARGNKIKIWGGIVRHDVPIRDAKTEEAQTSIEAALTAFDQRKETLLGLLRRAYERGPKSKPFDADETWRHLTLLARIYCSRRRARQEMMPAADCMKRLSEIAKALGRARRLVEKSMQDDVKGALFSAWYEENVRYDPAPIEPLTLVRIEDEFDKVVANLFALESSAHRAVNDVRTKAGRPKGTAILQRDDIEGLAALYRQNTGVIPGAGDGPFAKFVMEVLAALGRHLAYESVIDAIKDAGLRALMTAGWEEPSSFDEGA